MNILVIGNGFDLAHGLPTKYVHFLDFVKAIKQVININDQDNIKIALGDLDSRIVEQIKNDMESLSLFEEKWKELLDNNAWIDYFLQCDMHGNENWIDFEAEISEVIKKLDRDIIQKGHKDYLYYVVRKISDPFFATYFLDDIDSRVQARDMEACDLCTGMSVIEQSKFLEKYKKEHPVEALKDEITYKNLIARLENDLNKLIRALEIYLSEYVKNIDCEKKSIDIRNIIEETKKPVRVISFNYSDTYIRIYMAENVFSYEKHIDYIHGKAEDNNKIESNNMVLGIDEYLSKKRRDKDTEFIAFKKYYQRIYKGTGSKYKEWVDKIKESWENESIEGKAEIRKCIISGNLNSDKIHKLYIFGHSLDETDKDVLRDLILNDNVYTTIFYHSKEELGRKIANLVKVIGQDELIRRTGGSTRTIEFKEQQPMVERESD